MVDGDVHGHVNLGSGAPVCAGMRWIGCGGRREQLGAMGRAVLAAIHRPDAHPWLGGLFRRLQAIEPRIRPGITAVYEGEAEGVDREVREAALALGLPVVDFPVSQERWHAEGKPAGPWRNEEMMAGKLKQFRASPAHRTVPPAEAVLAAHGGTGTANMVKQARAAGLPVIDLADPLVTAALASYQRWTRHDASLVWSERRRCIEVQQTRPGVGPPIVSGHWLKVNGAVTIPPWCLYVGRDAHGVPAHPRLHNPFPVKPLADGRYLVHLPGGPHETDAAGALGFYRDHLAARLPQLRAELAAIVLQRRVLVCWCGESKPCHACVIAEFAVEIVAEGCFEAACRASTPPAVGATAAP